MAGDVRLSSVDEMSHDPFSISPTADERVTLLRGSAAGCSLRHWSRAAAAAPIQGASMADANDRVSSGTSDVERMRALFADAFGSEVLRELSLRLRLLRQRPAVRGRDWNRFAPARSPSRT